jgi:hypothetical protein
MITNTISILTNCISMISKFVPDISESLSFRHGVNPLFNKHLSFIGDKIRVRRGPA